MKITFWSPFSGQTGTTSNILAISLAAGMIYRKKIILTQTHFGFNNLEAPLVGSNLKIAETIEYFMDVGLDALMRNFKASRLDNEIIDNCCITFPNTNVSLLPGTLKSNRESFEYEMDSVIINLLRMIERNSRLLFIDASPGNNPISMKIMQDSDLIVINLCQNLQVLYNFFKQWKEPAYGKVFYLFGNYDCNSKYNIYNIQRVFKKHINLRNCGVIPYDTHFLDAQCDGRVVEFLKDRLHCSGKEEDWYFCHKVKSVTRKILKQAGISISNEEGKEQAYELFYG